MTPLDKLADAGITVTADGDRLLVHPRHLLTNGLRALVRDNKREILMALAGAPTSSFHPVPLMREQEGSCSATTPLRAGIGNGVTSISERSNSPQLLPELDERRTCRQCRNLSRDGWCLAAWRGELYGVSREFEPIDDMLQRCPGYAPGPDDPDQREGRFAAYCLSKMKPVTNSN